jgi:hypothetical protein
MLSIFIDPFYQLRYHHDTLPEIFMSTILESSLRNAHEKIDVLYKMIESSKTNTNNAFMAVDLKLSETEIKTNCILKEVREIDQRLSTVEEEIDDEDDEYEADENNSSWYQLDLTQPAHGQDILFVLPSEDSFGNKYLAGTYEKSDVFFDRTEGCALLHGQRYRFHYWRPAPKLPKGC